MPAVVEYMLETYPALDPSRVYVNGYTWLFDKDGVPMAGVNITDFLPHGLYPEYGKVAWDFMQHYSRDPETLEVIYTPYNP